MSLALSGTGVPSSVIARTVPWRFMHFDLYVPGPNRPAGDPTRVLFFAAQAPGESCGGKGIGFEAVTKAGSEVMSRGCKFITDFNKLLGDNCVSSDFISGRTSDGTMTETLFLPTDWSRDYTKFEQLRDGMAIWARTVDFAREAEGGKDLDFCCSLQVRIVKVLGPPDRHYLFMSAEEEKSLDAQRLVDLIAARLREGGMWVCQYSDLSYSSLWVRLL